MQSQPVNRINSQIPEHQRWLAVALFALAMAWVESSVVYYLRTMIDRIEPYQPNPLPLVGGLGRAELIREGATLVMLATAAWLAARSFRPRFGYFLMAFGVWDIGYYVFLKVLTDWPGSLFDWDILFLLPLPWWGPVLAPVTIAALMIVTGSLLTLTAPRDGGRGPRARAWWIAAAGATLALLVFMRDALQAVVTGNTALREVLPETFPWPVFLIAVGLMAAPAWDLFRERLGALAPTLSRRGAENVGSEQTLPSTLRISDAPTSSAEKDVAKRW